MAILRLVQEDGDGLGDVVDGVVRGGKAVRPGAAAQPEGVQSSLVAAADAPFRVVADHPTAFRQARAAPGGCEFEEASIRPADVRIARDSDAVLTRLVRPVAASSARWMSEGALVAMPIVEVAARSSAIPSST
ncbi:hypothetical protein [Streptomyces sp. NPDC098781]|uniref:hypothetical protein n=1 Tax=Streptomyces sp. NPDC098781 TaxID=3366097 RepID=UPI003819CE1A